MHPLTAIGLLVLALALAAVSAGTHNSYGLCAGAFFAGLFLDHLIFGCG